MLNQEGWSLLLNLILVLAALGLGLAQMGRERNMAQSLRGGGGAADTAVGAVLRCAGPLLLAVIPGAVYRGGFARAGIAVSAAAGYAVQLAVLTPALRRRSGATLTLPELAAEERGVRALWAALCSAQALLVAGGALAMAARLLAGVFSLHSTIALAACAGLCLLLTALCGPQSRLRMDRLQGALLVGLLVGLPAAAAVLFDGTKAAVLGGLALQERGAQLGLGIASDALWCVGILGLALPVQRVLGAENERSARRAGIAGGVLAAALTALAALAGLLGRSVDAELTGLAAAETVLMQMAQGAALPQPVSALFVGALTTTLLLTAQDALRALGGWVSWDVVGSLSGQTRERPLMRIQLGAAMAAVLAAFALGLSATVPLEWFALGACLVGAVLAPGLVLRACGRRVHPLGATCGLGLGALMAVVWMAVPQLRGMGMLGAVPCAGLSLLLQLCVREKRPDAKQEERPDVGQKMQPAVDWEERPAAEQAADQEEQPAAEPERAEE